MVTKDRDESGSEEKSASQERTSRAEAREASARQADREVETVSAPSGTPQQNTGTPGGTSTTTNEPTGDPEAAEPLPQPELGEYTCLRCKRRVDSLQTVEFDANDVPEGNPNNLPHKKYHGDVCITCAEALKREFEGL